MIIGPGPADLTGGYELANNRYKVLFDTCFGEPLAIYALVQLYFGHLIGLPK